MKNFEVEYSGSGVYSFIKASTLVNAENEEDVRVYMKKFYPSAVIKSIKEVI